MGLANNWPKNTVGPLKVKSDFTWKEVGILYRLISQYQVALVIETAVGSGDVAAWMIAKSIFDPDFSYIGITNDLTVISKNLEPIMPLAQGSSIIASAACSSPTMRRLSKMVKNTPGATLVICDGKDNTREFCEYANILRSGDILVANGLAGKFHFMTIKRMEDAGTLKRITGDWTISDFIIGEVL